MQMIVALLVGFFLNLAKRTAAFFLSGGAVVFTALASLVAFIAWAVGEIGVYSDQIAQQIHVVSNLLSSLEISHNSQLANTLIYYMAAHSLVSYFITFVTILFSVLLFITVGLMSTAVGFIVPLVLFRVIYFIKTQFTS